MAGSTETKTKWHRVADLGEIPEGRVRAVNAGARTLALVHFDHQWSAMDARCPHEGPTAKDPSKKGPTVASGCVVPGMAGILTP